MNILIDGTLIIKTEAEHFDFEWRKLTSELFSSHRVIEQVDIDGQPIHGNYEQVIKDNMNKIKQINVLTISEETFLRNILNELSAVNGKLLSSSVKLSNKFYGEVEENDWEQFIAFVEGVEWEYAMIQTIQNVSMNAGQEIQSIPIDFILIQQQIAEKIRLLENAIHEMDYVTIGDLLIYEFNPIFEQINNNISEIIKIE